MRSCISFGRCTSVKRPLFFRSLSCPIKEFDSSCLPVSSSREIKNGRRQVLNRPVMRNFLARTLSGQCMTEIGQDTGMEEVGPCRAVDTGELCEMSCLRSTLGSSQGTQGSAEVRQRLKGLHRNWAKMGK